MLNNCEKSKLNPISKLFDKTLYLKYRTRLVLLDEESASVLPSDEKYDRIRFIREDTARRLNPHLTSILNSSTPFMEQNPVTPKTNYKPSVIIYDRRVS